MTAKICILLLLTNLVFALSIYAQNFNIPRDGFSIALDDSIIIEKGTFKKINIWVLRAKASVNKNVRMEISSPLPEGVLINFEPDFGDFDLGKALIQVNPLTKAGSYFIILSGTIHYKTKGRVLKLIITDTTPGIKPLEQ
jgi:hypothetical protein